MALDEDEKAKAKTAAPATNKAEQYVLPASIVGPADVNRSLLELRQIGERLEQEMMLNDLDLKPPVTTLSLGELVNANKADLRKPEDRKKILTFLESLQQRAPVLHISFASDPSPEFMERIIVWLRGNISHYTLVQIGLQPSIAGGCIVRSTNKIFDLSLRRHMQQNRGKMIELLHKLREKEEVAQSQASQTPQLVKSVGKPA